jgi:hypothetical protein
VSYQSAILSQSRQSIATRVELEPEAEAVALRDDNGTVVAYVWQDPSGGYVVTSADDRIEPVIMQASSGVFPTNLPNPVASFIVWDMSARLKALESDPKGNQTVAQTNGDRWQNLSTGVFAPAPAASSVTWGPLVTTLWEQSGRYNNKCPYRVPLVPGPRRLVGCSATAISQLLNFWKYPKLISFDHPSNQYEAEGINFDGDAATYGFPSFTTLSDSLSTIAYDDSDAEVANLSFAVGLKIKSAYTALGGTSAYPSGFDDALLNAFGFGCARYGAKSWATYVQIARSNVQQGRPLILAIKKSPPLEPDGHAVLIDGYRDSDGFFHLNFGWGMHPATSWYNLPSSYSAYDAIFAVIYDIDVYFGWPQYGFDEQNTFFTVYGAPPSPPHVKYTRSTRDDIQGFIIGEGNWIFATHDPLIVNDVYHPSITAVDQYGTPVHDLEVTQSTSTISPPVQAPNGDVFFGAGDSVYRFRPRNGSISRIFQDAGNTFYGDATPRVDADGSMYFGSTTTLVSIDQNGAERWRWNVPEGGVMNTGIPAVDSERNNVYIGYWVDSTDEAVLVCINRSTGTTRFSKSFTSIPTADRGIYTPAVGLDGTVFLSVRTKIYALTPGTSSFSEKWVQDKTYAKYQPIALGADDSVYTEYWTQSGGSYFLTLAKLNPSNGSVVWERPKPDIGTVSGFRQPICAANGVVLFPVYWDTAPNRTWQLYAYSTSGDFLWDYALSPPSALDMAIASGGALCIAETTGNIIALSDGDIGDPKSGGMGFADNSPPALPANMTPTNMSVLATNSVTLGWTCSDPDAHTLKYDVFIGRATTNEVGGDLVPVTNSAASTSISVTNLAYGATYVWMVRATDGQALSYSPMQSFTIAPGSPTITCPGNITTNNASGQCGRSLAFAPVVTGDPAPTITCKIGSTLITSPHTFLVGTSTVDCTASNVVGTTNCSFNVTVNDTQLPSIVCPANIVTSTAPGQCARTLSFAPTVGDNCGVASTNCTPASGTSFSKGTNTVNCTVTDTSGNSNGCSFTITVSDAQSPSINCPGNVTSNVAAGVTNSIVTYGNPTVSDNCGVASTNCAPPSGSTFALGTNAITCMAIDTSGNTNSCTFQVVVTAAATNQPPMAVCHDVTTNASANCTVSINATAVDNGSSDPDGTITNRTLSPAGPYGLGTNNVTLTVTDDDGATNSCAAKIIVHCIETNTHDLAVLKVKVPKTVTLKPTKPTITKQVVVTIQNMSEHNEEIPDFETLSDLVQVTLTPRNTNSCAAPAAVLITGPANKLGTLGAGKNLNVFFDVTFACANDPVKSSNKTGERHDYTYTVSVNHTALDDNADTNSDNDECPRPPDPATGDKGCGGKDPVTKQLGAAIETDVVEK